MVYHRKFVIFFPVASMGMGQKYMNTLQLTKPEGGGGGGEGGKTEFKKLVNNREKTGREL